MLAAIVALAPFPARAQIIECYPYEFAWWTASEFGSSYTSDADAKAHAFSIDLATGAYHHGETTDRAAADLSYDVIRTGEYGTTEDVDFVAFHRATASLIRIRLTNSELQFLHDYGRTLETGTCSIKQGADNGN
jgi:hypothetical protein